MAAVQTIHVSLMTEEEYLAFADAHEFKFEYKRGRVYDMAGASLRHSIISASTIAHLSMSLGDRDCTGTSSHTRLHIASKQTYRYPDVTVFCGAPAYPPGRADTLTNPVLLVEVLSAGTALRDYNEKLEEYTQIETLEAYVLVSQDQPKVEVYRRYEDSRWLYEYATGLDAEITVPLPGGDIRLSLAQIYRRVQWDAPEADATETG